MIAGSKTDVMIAFLVGAGVMALGGIAEIFLGVDAEQEQLEDVAEPITAQGAGGAGEPEPDRHARRESRRSAGRYGPQRFRPGAGSTFYSPGMLGTSYSSRRASESVLDREVDSIVRALEQEGRPVERHELERLLRTRVWGPGRLALALNEAVAEGHVRRVGRSRYEAVAVPHGRRPERHSARVES